MDSVLPSFGLSQSLFIIESCFTINYHRGSQKTGFCSQKGDLAMKKEDLAATVGLSSKSRGTRSETDDR